MPATRAAWIRSTSRLEPRELSSGPSRDNWEAGQTPTCKHTVTSTLPRPHWGDESLTRSQVRSMEAGEGRDGLMKVVTAGRSQAGVPPSAHLAQPLHRPAALRNLNLSVTPCRRRSGHRAGSCLWTPRALSDSVPSLERSYHASSPCKHLHLQAQLQGPICILQTPQGSPSSTYLVAPSGVPEYRSFSDRTYNCGQSAVHGSVSHPQRGHSRRCTRDPQLPVLQGAGTPKMPTGCSLS